MAYYDLREFLAKLEEEGELVKIEKEVDWNLEAGAILRRCNETEAVAPLFQNIKDYPSGYRLTGGTVATLKRFALSMNMAPDSTYRELQDAFLQRVKHTIKPNLVNDGPCKENIFTGDEVDLFKLPAPMIHEGDGGRYIGTWHVTAIKDPDSDWQNWGMYRLMVHDKNSMGGIVIPSQHNALLMKKYEERNQPTPFAVCIGVDPIVTFIGSCGIPYGVSEVDVIGSMRQEPLNVIKCETSDLMVPATAEIVIEGEILPGELKDEGPFGEHTGYVGGGRAPRPVYRVKAITHRNDPILTMSNMGVPIDDGDVCTAVSWGGNLKEELLRHGFPITDVFIPPESCLYFCFVSTKTPYAHIANRIASAIWAQKDGLFISKIVVMNEDVDIYDRKQVLHAFGTKLDPVRGITTMPIATSPLTPFLDPRDRQLGKSVNVLFDCTWPLEWSPEDIPRKSSFDNIYPKEMQEKVLKNWTEYGF